ncbi:MAG: IS3 family transposase [Ignavibacteria bacterium]|nr:IS3 family transposase [Ignavibacteria bacterium]
MSIHSTREQQQRACEKLRNRITENIQRIHAWSNGTYGSPRITSELRKSGDVITHKTVERLMYTLGIRVSAKRRYRPTTDSSQTRAPAANLLQRAFDIQHPDKVWLSDFTELPCRNGKAYAVAIMDLCSRRILGVTVSHSMQTKTLLHALAQACRLRRHLPSEPVIFHSDRGSQFNADIFKTELAKRNIVQSIDATGVGNCSDNAPMESVWSRMKAELHDHKLFDDLRQAGSVVYRWVHLFYNHQRLHSGINYMTPTEFEHQLLTQSNERLD